MMNKRNLIHTGGTRGKQLVVMVGQQRALAMSVRTVDGVSRNTKLREWLAATYKEVILKIWFLAALLPIAGCSTVGEHLRSEYEAAQHRDSPEVALAKRVAESGTHQTYATNLLTMKGYYGGRLPDGCHAVAVQTNEFKGTNHFRVCPGGVSEVGVLAPAAPKGKRFDTVSDSLARAAWSSSMPQISELDGYLIEAVPVGPADAQACRFVEERTRHQDSIVQIRTRRICP